MFELITECQFELDRSEAAEAALSAASVVGVFDPGDDRVVEFVACGPGPAVEDVLLEQ
jgi:hypothetical protein